MIEWRLLPSSAGFREFNPCHRPGGSPDGGQFCSDNELAGPKADDYLHGYPEAQARALDSARRAMLHASFESGEVRETMSIVDAKGVYVGEMMTGDKDSVAVPKEVWKEWIAKGPVVTAHTHPNSGTFSFDDFRVHNMVNAQAQIERPTGEYVRPSLRNPPLAVTAMQVYGDDGSWYEIRFGRILNHPEMQKMHLEFETKRQLAQGFASTATTKWAAEQPWMKISQPVGGTRLPTNDEVHHAAKTSRKTDALNAHFAREFRDKVAHVWTGLAAQYGFTYRYHLTD